MELCYLTSNLSNKYASAPELYVRSAETQTDTKTPKAPQSNTSILVEDTSISHDTSTNTQYIPPFESGSDIFRSKPSRIGYLAQVYVLLIIQVGMSTLQWLVATYRMRVRMSGPERNFHVLVLFLIWLNLTLAFFGFRRLQMTSPINWIVFVCIFESLTLLVMCICTYDMELTWHFIVVSVVILLIYTLLGLWLPAFLTVNLWILVFLSISVLVTSTVALVTSLAMHLYVPLVICLMLFGPWTMYNAFHLHGDLRDSYWRCSYLRQAAKMFITFGCTVGGLVVVSHIAHESIEIKRCMSLVFCDKESLSLTYEAGN
ncbi:uncharacterized protein LOC111592588 [Drosophila hydei]|uniref:Uncharacterized protein LOC111592588 n=1 Tax=Drosophila hydei TaxID=7224 RepID=A0A6J1L2R1_DROHY|nr:uncharacterized protein LOC111592588 [Drosophila hydei]